MESVNPAFEPLLKDLGLQTARHWEKVSRNTKIFKMPGGSLIYVKESSIVDRGAWWGLRKDVIDVLERENVPWRAVLLNLTNRSGYIIEGQALLGIAKSKPVARDGDYKFYEDSPDLRPLPKVSIDDIKNLLSGQSSPRRSGESWTREDDVLSLALYKATGPSHDASDPEVRDLARLIQRTPDSVAQKMANFRAIETEGRHGLRNFTALDSKTWNEYLGKENELRLEAEKIRTEIYSNSQEIVAEQLKEDENRILNREKLPTERFSEVRVRQQTQALRQVVLDDYDRKCAFCDMDVPQLLEISHIRGWRVDEANRLNPANALCLCLLHHGAFDQGLVTILPNGSIRVSSQVKTSLSATTNLMLISLDGKQVRSPRKFLPDPKFLTDHRDKVFKD